MSTQTLSASSPTQVIRYDDAIVRKFAVATVIWGIVGMLAGVWIALELASPAFNLGLSFLSFGRLRPLHTNAVIFAFVGNGMFAGIYYSTQRLLKARMASDALSAVNFWGWQLIIVSAALTLPFGITSGKEYAELEWPIDIAIAVVWVLFGVNFFLTLAQRRERHLYVALWFYIASIVTVAMLHVVNSLAIPVGMHSYSVFAGVQDALVQWWYGHNAVAFFLTTPFLGLMYYFVPKVAGRPVYSYRLSIIHFWALVFLYIWAGPHHLLNSALPDWAQTLGTTFSIMLLAPSWGGMINGLLTLRGAWDKLRTDPVLKFFVAALTFYGMSTFEGPLMSLKSVNALSHFTNWTVAHAHAGGLGWNGLFVFGMLYWLLPRLWGTELYSLRLATTHFWFSLVGIGVYVLSMYASGITEGLIWKEFQADGRLTYGTWDEMMPSLLPMYWVRAIGGTLYLAGALMWAYNLWRTWQNRASTVADTEARVPAAMPHDGEHGGPFHRLLEGRPLQFSLWITVAAAAGGLFELIPTMAIRSNVPTIDRVKPYTPLELEGRDIYRAEGCVNCHSQMVRPFREETIRYGEYSKPGEYVYDRPFLWGSRRIGPDLMRIGGKYGDMWHYNHMKNPRSTSPSSIMPTYEHLFTETLDLSDLPGKIRAFETMGAKYEGQDATDPAASARAQAERIAKGLVDQGLEDLRDKKIVALIAYLQRLGTDVKKP